MTEDVICPKCGRSFEAGSRRFCPTDGARLVLEGVDPDNYSEGIFADLLPRSSQVGAMDEQLNDSPTFTLIEEEPDLLGVDLFRPIPAPDPEDEAKAATPASPKAGRKVNPDEIPAGHVDLDDTERPVTSFDDIDTSKPEMFVGRTVKGRYTIAQFIGGDETGLAYVADDRIGSRKVLVRILLEDGIDSVEGSVLAEERVALSHFSHPNISRLIDSGSFTNGVEFLISEYADALSVREALGIHGTIPPQRAARIIRQAAYALSEAHQEGVVHRDLRPEHFILTTEGDVEGLKIVNFGVSTGRATPRNAAYKAPEVLEGEDPSEWGDVYSLAVVAHEILTGKVPFDGPTAKELIRSQKAGLGTLPSQLNKNLPADVDAVLERALSADPAARYLKARELGDAIYEALDPESRPQPVAKADPVRPALVTRKIETLKPIETLPKKTAEPAWKSRSPEPPQEETSRAKVIGAILGAVLIALLVFGWYYVVTHPTEPGIPEVSGTNPVTDLPTTPTISSDVEMPPQPRKITQPPNSEYFANSKQNLREDLLRNFVGFSLYYPKDWKVVGPQPGTAGTRGKFLDVARLNSDGTPKEQMLISYYPSKGTFTADAATFTEMAKETNETLKKIVPGYQMVSEGEIRVNGDWNAYEVKFTGSGTAANGENITVWGRRLFMPAARPGVRNGFEITMLATSAAEDVKSVDDVGVRGELAPILYSFEPSQNF